VRAVFDPLVVSLKVAASGLEAQSKRMRVVSENMANAESTGKTPGADAYARKSLGFESALDELTGASVVRAEMLDTGRPNFRIEHDPDHPAADANGNVKMPDVNLLLEMADMREANRSYEANLQVMKQAKAMISMTLDLLRTS